MGFPASTLDIPNDADFSKFPYFGCEGGSQAFVYMQNQNDLKGTTFTGTAEFKVKIDGNKKSVNIVDAKKMMEVNWISGSLTAKDDDCPTEMSITVPEDKTNKDEEFVVAGKGNLSVEFAEESWPNILQFELTSVDPSVHIVWKRDPEKGTTTTTTTTTTTITRTTTKETFTKIAPLPSPIDELDIRPFWWN